MTVRSAWHINNSQSREDTRLAPVGTMTPVDAMQTRAGLIPGGTPCVLTSTGAMTFTIGTGRAVVQGTSAQGAYPVVVTVSESFTVADGHATLPRIDSVFLVVYDTLYDSSGQTAVQLQLVQGTAASSPVAPALPTTSSLRLYDISVPAGTSAGTGGVNWSTGVTDQRVYTVAVGGIQTGTPAGAYAGQYRDQGGTTGPVERYNGTSWEPRVYLGNSGRVVLGDAYFYRSAASTAAVNQNFRVDGNMSLGGTVTDLPSGYTDDATDRTLTSTTYTDVGFGVMNVNLVCPPSRKVMLAFCMTARNDTASNQVYASVRATEGAQTVFPESDTNAITLSCNQANESESSSHILRLDFSTLNGGSVAAGDEVSFKMYHKVQGGTATILDRNISVWSLPA